MAAVTPADIKAEPLAVWDCRDRRGLFRSACGGRLGDALAGSLRFGAGILICLFFDGFHGCVGDRPP